MSAGDLGAYSAAGADAGDIDFSKMGELFKGNGMPEMPELPGLSGIDASEMNDLIADVQRNPQALQKRMRDEFKHLPPDEQNRMLDALAATGMASRAWWERFLRG